MEHNTTKEKIVTKELTKASENKLGLIGVDVEDAIIPRLKIGQPTSREGTAGKL
jgi:hypothetical protein